MSEKKQELKPCPFCKLLGEIGIVSVGCFVCKITFPYSSPIQQEEAIRRWNTRFDKSVLIFEIEALIERYNKLKVTPQIIGEDEMVVQFLFDLQELLEDKPDE